MFNRWTFFGDSLTKRNCYKKATSKPFGHLLIDFDQRTGDSLRFCSIKVGPACTFVYLPSSFVKETPFADEREKIAFSKALAKKQEAERLKIFWINLTKI